MLHYFLNSSLPEAEFNRIIKELHSESLGQGQPELRTSKAGRDVTKYPVPESAWRQIGKHLNQNLECVGCLSPNSSRLAVTETLEQVLTKYRNAHEGESLEEVKSPQQLGTSVAYSSVFD
ncbi:hypothetical protein WN943_010348 [Citrus x changshan-huyou]